MKLVIRNHRPVSWNRLYSQRHWSKRKALVDEVHLLTRAAIPVDVQMYEQPVAITVTAFSRGVPIDADNVAAKLYIDTLKGWLIQDDDRRFVREVTTRSMRDNDPRVEIVITEVTG